MRLALVAATVTLCAPPTVRARDPVVPASGGALGVVAEPPALLLGRDATAELRITVPTDVEDLALFASTGRVEDLRRASEGVWTARYRAPAERFPQVALLAAVSRSPRGTEDGWLALPLSGQGDVKLRTEPGTQVSLRVGGRVFGPRRASGDGSVSIPVVVPPGVRQAHHGFTPIDLNVPEVPPLLALLDRSTILADREEQVRALVLVVAPHGAARRGDVPTFEPTRGSVSVTEREAGAYPVTWTLPPGRAGEERLVVQLSAAPASRSVLRLDVVPGPAAAIAVSFDRRALVAGAAESVGVTARALDAAGNGVPAALDISSDGGELGDVREAAPGVLTARLRAGPRFEGRREIRVTASAAGVRISGGRALPLRPGEPATAIFAEDGGVLRANGAREEVLHVAVADRHGNPVEAEPAVTAQRGEVTRVVARAPGVYEVHYRAPPVEEPTEERIVARVAGAQAIARRLLVPDRGRLAGTAAGGVSRDGRGGRQRAWFTAAFEAAADLTSAVGRGLAPAWRLEAGLLRDSRREAGTLLAGLSVRKHLEPRGELRLGALGGVALGEGGVAPAARLAAELGLARGRVRPFAEAGLLVVSGGSPGEFAAFTLSIGVRFGAE